MVAVGGREKNRAGSRRRGVLVGRRGGRSESRVTPGGLLRSRDSMAETLRRANLPASGGACSSSEERPARSPQDARLGNSREAEAKQGDEGEGAAGPGSAKASDRDNAFVTPFEWVARH